MLYRITQWVISASLLWLLLDQQGSRLMLIWHFSSACLRTDQHFPRHQHSPRTSGVWISDRWWCFEDRWQTAHQTGSKVLLMSDFKPPWTFAATPKCYSCRNTAGSSTPGWEQGWEAAALLGTWRQRENEGMVGHCRSGRADSSPEWSSLPQDCPRLPWAMTAFRRTLHKTHPWIGLTFLFATYSSKVVGRSWGIKVMRSHSWRSVPNMPHFMEQPWGSWQD